MPEDGDVTPLRDAAIQVHELYLELKKTGFSRSESMELISRVLAQSIMNEQQNGD